LATSWIVAGCCSSLVMAVKSEKSKFVSTENAKIIHRCF